MPDIAGTGPIVSVIDDWDSNTRREVHTTISFRKSGADLSVDRSKGRPYATECFRSILCEVPLDACNVSDMHVSHPAQWTTQ